jgi:succinate-semialdehyde dehydrogenase/glutarate-semialdehyde dehydrogenase
MELGGNAPFIIFEDADIDAAVEGALIAKMRNGGEACTAANRFYVHEAVADDFSSKFAARLDAMKVGPGLDEDTDVGPLVNEPTRSKVAELVDSAAADGGKVVTGGRAPASSPPRSSGRWRPWSGSPPRTTLSAGPMTPSSGWSPTSTLAI